MSDDLVDPMALAAAMPMVNKFVQPQGDDATTSQAAPTAPPKRKRVRPPRRKPVVQPQTAAPVAQNDPG